MLPNVYADHSSIHGFNFSYKENICKVIFYFNYNICVVFQVSHLSPIGPGVWVRPQPTHQVDELGDGELADGLLHTAQGLQRGAKAAGQVAARDGDKIVLAPVQVQHQDVLDLVLARVEQRDRVLADVHLQVDL